MKNDSGFLIINSNICHGQFWLKEVFFETPCIFFKKQIWRPNNLGYMQFCLCPYWSDVLIWVFSSSFNTTSRSTSSNSQKSRTSTYSLSKNGSCGKFQSSKAVSVRPFVKKLFDFAACRFFNCRQIRGVVANLPYAIKAKELGTVAVLGLWLYI